MNNILGSIALAYLAGSGSVTNSSVVGRGLFRAIRHIVEGDYREPPGYAVINPKLSGEDFTEAVQIAQAKFNKHVLVPTK